MNETRKLFQSLMMDSVLEIVQDDPHQWSTRPCTSCKTITSLIGKPFGCEKYKEQRKKTKK